MTARRGIGKYGQHHAILSSEHKSVCGVIGLTQRYQRVHIRLPRKAIKRLPPYPSLLLVGVPLAIVEPLKLAILFFAGKGHWLTGAIAMICAYAVSLFVTERLFVIVRPKLMELSWFAAGWTYFVSLRRKAWFALRRLWPGRKPRPVKRRSRASAAR